MAVPVDLPPGAQLHLPVLVREIDQHWPDIPLRSFLAAQVEQESLWKERATLNNPKNHELGAGLGQMTKTNRFDAIKELRDRYPKLFSGWGWNNPYDVDYQLRGVVIKNRDNYRAIKWAADDYNRLAFTDSAYNSGLGSTMKRRTMCLNTKGCNPGLWFGNAELTSPQSKSPSNGYKQSFADITRTHVKNVMIVRRVKYVFMDKENEK